ncbi:hypothetical protein [Capnocytophaga canimorsus]|nr:hypothetical protein [Capnocytophaga canimorsus]
MLQSEMKSTTMNNSNCVVQNRNKLHKVTELKEQDAFVLAQFSITPRKRA